MSISLRCGGLVVSLTIGLATDATAANRIFNFDVVRQHDAATISWESRFPGVNDTLRYRVTDAPKWQVAVNPDLQGTTSLILDATLLLIDAGVDVGDGDTDPFRAALSAGGIDPPYEEGFLEALQAFDRILRSRRHRITTAGLLSDTQYEYEALSVSLQDNRSELHAGFFRTRAAPDLRQVTGTDLDIQTTPSTAVANWFTNRACDTRLLVNEIGLEPDIEEARLDEGQGSLFHIASAAGLKPDTEYEFVVTSRLVGADGLIAAGMLTEDDASVVKTGSFRTRRQREPLRLLIPPARILSAERATIDVRFNQIALATIDYGEVPSSDAYPISLTSADILRTHSITLSDLTPATTYRYRIGAVTPDGDSLTTDPGGNEQWNRDLTFSTAAAGDTLPPVIIEGPSVIAGDVIAIVSFTTDVDTRATVFFGTRGGTYGTADEFEIPDHTPDGKLRLSHEHFITIGGLDLGTEYEYGILVEAPNGKSASFERDLFAGKVTAVHQPPGGGGSFTTSNQPDTQFPVILSGPTVTSKTHDTAIVEYTTDEPATGEVRFGTLGLDDFANSGESRTKHKFILSNLDPATRYNYLVASTDASGNGATESAMAVFTTDPEIDVTAPSLGDPVIIYKNDESATVQWTADEESTGEVEFGADTGPRLHPQLARDGLTARDHADEPGGEHEVFLQGLLVGFEQQRSQRVNGVFLHHRCDG